MTNWIDHCEKPRQRPQGVEWDVFISYRSLNRMWAIALYDILTQCGYTVFLDQFVLVPGRGLATQLGKNLDKSASGILIWSQSTADSHWVESELNSMVARKNNTVDSVFPFFFVVASLDGKKPPGLQDGQLYLNFEEHMDGPTGAELVRLTCGLQGKALNSKAVKSVVEFEQAIKDEPSRLRAMATSNMYQKIIECVKSDEPAYTTFATLSGVAIDLLIRGEKYSEAISTVKFALERFPKSIRLQQLHGLALRRIGQLGDAAFVLNSLLEKDHRDTETLGILAAVWADLWQQRIDCRDASEARDALEKSRNLYKEGFNKVPSDTYTGINAASKSALLGEIEEAQALADQVLNRLKEMENKRRGEPSQDYWERVTEPEALLLKGDWQKALTLYHDARVAHHHETGSIQSTATQLKRLLNVLAIPDNFKQKFSDEFKLQ